MSRFHPRPLILFVLLLLGQTAGCSSFDRINPSFPLTVSEAEAALRAMRDDPKPFDRPVLIIGGWANTRLMTARLAGAVRSVGIDDIEVEHVSLMSSATFEHCRERVIEAVDRAFTDADAEHADADAGATIEVDVIGFSMGGLVARYAAAPRTDGGRQLRIHRLFTIATPHRGADMAALAPYERRAADMCCGSALLNLLNLYTPQPDFEIISYVRLGDMIVGEQNCALHGCYAWWVPNRAFEGAHHDAFRDPRIIADIARRLRGETPFTRSPPSPLPAQNAPAATVDPVTGNTGVE
jgi:pimeloyl-ACP methyl ester carboxylesterase